MLEFSDVNRVEWRGKAIDLTLMVCLSLNYPSAGRQPGHFAG